MLIALIDVQVVHRLVNVLKEKTGFFLVGTGLYHVFHDFLLGNLGNQLLGFKSVDLLEAFI